MGSCKEWCSETIEGILADSLEDYKLFQQEKLTPGLGKELEDMIVEYFASIDKMPLLKESSGKS